MLTCFSRKPIKFCSYCRIIFPTAVLVLTTFLFLQMAVAEESVGIRVKARELLQAMGIEKDLQELKTRLFDAQYKRKPKLKAFQGAVNSYYEQTMSLQAMDKELVDLCVQNLNEDALQQAIDLYRTPTGKKLLEALPKIRTGAKELGYKKGVENISKLNKTIQAEYKMIEPSMKLPGEEFKFPR